MKAIVIIPTYNEKGNIERIIPVVEEVFKEVKNYDMGILVVDDSSPDGTAEIVKGLMKQYDNLHLLVGQKNGLGAAYLRGMTYAINELNADVMFEMDADFFHDPKKIPDFLQKIDEGNDFVIGTRYSKGGSIPANWGIHRKIMSVWGNLLIRMILMRFSIHDWTGGYRAIKKAVFLKEKEKLTAFSGYTFQVGSLLNAVQDGFKVAEVPFHATDRTMGKSKIPGIETIIKTLYYVITARIKELIFGPFGKFLVVGGLGFVLQAVILRVMVGVFNIDPTISNLTGAVVAIFSNFNFNNLWTFKTEKINGLGQYLWKLMNFYATSAIGVIIIQTGIIFLGDTLFGKKFYFLYFIIGTGFLLIYNFTVYRLIIWRKKPSK
ncbi:MAG TPA: glycosyltransferase [Patescibacteria group bacterium]|jgi:dolichol-phosphate mannosyltransferase|nr:glycosyltransferase [Patescibacteria group bacterium]